MRKELMLLVVLCLSAAWSLAQQPTSPRAPADSSSQNTTQTAPGGEPASPGAKSGAAGQSAPGAGAVTDQGSNVSIVEGCLGGANPNYTVTDKKGTTYKLVTPPAADLSVLSKHVGEAVAVMGTVINAGATTDSSASSTSSGTGASAASSSQPSVQVMRIGRGTGDCSATSGVPRANPPASKR